MQSTGLGIDLRMRRQRAADTPAIGVAAARGERVRIEFERPVEAFQREQSTAMPDNIGIGDVVAESAHLRRTGRGIAKGAVQGAAGNALTLEFLAAHLAVAVADAAIFEAEGVCYAVAGKHVVLVAR